jgi:hypothetical protein
MRSFTVIALLWGYCFTAYLDNWSYGIYRDLQQIGFLNLECVGRYAAGKGDGICPETHVKPIGRYFDAARSLDAHFTRQFRTSGHGNKGG